MSLPNENCPCPLSCRHDVECHGHCRISQPVASEPSSGERDWMARLGFELQDQSGVWVVIDDCGGVRPANLTEIVLWDSLLSSDAKPASEPVAAPQGFVLVPVESLTQLGDAFAEELSAFDIDPPLHHVLTSHDEINAMLSATPSPASVGINGLTKSDDRRVAELEEELSVSDKLLRHREQLLNAIPDCPVHGQGCVSHALEWIEKAKLVMQSEIMSAPNDQEHSMTADEAVKIAAHGLLAFADRNGVVLTIERMPLYPLAMGHAEYVVETRPVRVPS